MPEAIQPPKCAHCERLLRAHFLVIRYNPSGAAVGQVRVCSLVCLAQWAARFAVEQGHRGVDLLKGAARQLAEAIGKRT